MRLHRGGGRVVAHARRSLGGQVIGTGIHHDFRWHHRCTLASPVVDIAGCVVEATAFAPLMTRLRLALGISPTRVVAVLLSAIVGLAEVDDPRAARAANTHKNLDFIHARTATAALMELAPPVRLRAPSPGQRPRATRRLRGSTPGPSSIRGHRSLRDAVPRSQFSPEGSTSRFLRI